MVAIIFLTIGDGAFIHGEGTRFALPRGEHLGTQGRLYCCEDKEARHPALWGPAERGLGAGSSAGCLWDGLLELALIFQLLEFCSSVPPNLGEVRHMESREQC